MKYTKYQRGAYHWKWYEERPSYKSHVDRIREWIHERYIIDIGAGDGLITSFFIDACGIDNEPEAVRLAKEKGVPVVFGDAYDLKYEDGAFESALMADSLEHLESPEKALKEARRVITGYLYITTPPRGITSMSPFHYQEWTPDELQALVEAQGFSLVEEILVVPEEECMYAKFAKI